LSDQIEKFYFSSEIEMNTEMNTLITNIKTPLWVPSPDLKDSVLCQEKDVRLALVDRWTSSLENRFIVTIPRGKDKLPHCYRSGISLDKDDDVCMTYVFPTSCGWGWEPPVKVPQNLLLNPNSTIWKDTIHNETHKIPELKANPFVECSGGDSCYLEKEE